MAVKVLVRRSVQSNQREEAFELFKKIRIKAIDQPGYISGQTLVDHYNPENTLVISIWQTTDDWVNWKESDDRFEIDAKLEKLLKEPAQYEVYNFGLLSKDKGFLI